MTKYLFKNLSFWSQAACDCGFGECLGEYVELYKSELGLAYGEKECYIQAIKAEFPSHPEPLHSFHVYELRRLAKTLGIEVEII